MLNRSTAPQRLNVKWAGKRWTQIERTSQTLANSTSSSLPGDLIVQPGEILTLSNFQVD